MLEGGPMELVSLFEWFAQASIVLAEQANEAKQRETFTRLAMLWATAAAQQKGSGEAPTMQSTASS